MAKQTHNHKGHRQRLKTQMIESDLSSFPTHNILEAILFYSIPQVDTNNIAHELLNKFDSLSGIINAKHEQLCMVNGVKDNTSLLIKLIAEITKRYWIEQEDSINQKNIFNSVVDIATFLVNKYIGYNDEHAFVMYLDDKLKLISFEKISSGQNNSVSINKRELIAKIIKYDCTRIVLSHNHPLGDTQPSPEDFSATMDLKKLLESIGVELVDHIIISGKSFSSMRQLKLI